MLNNSEDQIYIESIETGQDVIQRRAKNTKMYKIIFWIKTRTNSKI